MLLDLMLPGRGEVELMQQAPELSGLPVIFILGCGREEAVVRALPVNAGRVMTHDVLLRRVWGRREDAGVQAVRNFVKKLRRKPGGDPARPAFIRNVRGVGCTMPKPGEG